MSKFIANIVFLAALLPVFGQDVSNAVVVGSVVDPSQSAIHGAAVTLTHLATGAVTQIKTDERV